MFIGAVLYFMAVQALANGAQKGDNCTFFDDTVGVCMLATDCPDLTKHELKMCSMVSKTVALICCEIESTTTTTTTTEVSTTREPEKSNEQICLEANITSSFDYSRANQTGYVSDFKCCEYTKYAYVTLTYSIGFREKVQMVLQKCLVHHEVIVGGTEAYDYEFPHMALLGYGTDEDTKWLCGGSLISENMVLTAAHCLNSNWGDAKWILLGARNITAIEEHRHKYSIAEYYIHPDYEYPAQYIDVALLKVQGQVHLSHWIRPACLHTQYSPMGDRFVATGWGSDNPYKNKGTNVLMKVTLEEFSENTCKQAYVNDDVKYPEGFLVDRLVCAGSNQSKDTCMGDSGGPLQVYDTLDCMYRIYGVTSAGKHCGIRRFPAIYNRVSYYIDWLERTVWPELKEAPDIDNKTVI